MRPNRGTAICALALLFAAAAGAQEIHKYRTRDGRVFFGDKPPEGSTDLGAVGEKKPRGRVLTDEDVAADEAKAVAPVLPEPTIEAGGTVLTDREVAADAATAANAEPTPEPTIDAAEARRAALASAVRIVATTATPQKKAWRLAGSVENTGPERVTGVEIGSVGAWKHAEPKDLAPGEFATFVLEVPSDAPVRAGMEPPDLEVRWKEQASN